MTRRPQSACAPVDAGSYQRVQPVAVPEPVRAASVGAIAAPLSLRAMSCRERVNREVDRREGDAD